jgi:choline dehydrogenase-like flavoprotein
MTALDADVIVVGYGPVGQTIAALLGREGHRVAIYERFSEIYALPRAIHFDDEIMRIWQQLGIVDEIGGDLMPSHRYTWFGAGSLSAQGHSVKVLFYRFDNLSLWIHGACSRFGRSRTSAPSRVPRASSPCPSPRSRIKWPRWSARSAPGCWIASPAA